ncbi:BgTH12-05789 [Blumeria graminis f. sp. triticale]|uniref:Bgt-50885 n=2 Tax=Blumeria graminis TaxID=34373 RepID=A0A9X9MLE1_BLUGR|nr:BgTH12-05789 [Blumeria graminis f. sp. triticale]VDB90794.1 Bgt-50885 [Blumeria graminis f. sp. tritici]
MQCWATLLNRMLCIFQCSDVRSIDRAHPKSGQFCVSKHRLQEQSVTRFKFRLSMPGASLSHLSTIFLCINGYFVLKKRHKIQSNQILNYNLIRGLSFRLYILNL